MKQDTHRLPSGTVMDSQDSGRIVLTSFSEGQQIVTSADELCYVLQYYQTRWGGIPVKMDLSKWRGLIGNPTKER